MGEPCVSKNVNLYHSRPFDERSKCCDYPLEAASGFGGLLDGMPVSCAGFNPDIQGAVLREFYKLEEVF